MTKLKYLQVVQKITPAMQRCLGEIPRRGGMYNWLFLFKGSMIGINQLSTKMLEDHDVIQVNLAPVDQPLVHQIRKMLPKSSSTLIIGNNDYTCESWELWQNHPQAYEHAQDVCDAVFGTEPYQTSFLRDDAFVIPHPHWVDFLKHVGSDDVDLDRYQIGYMFHWWEAKSYSASVILSKLRKKYANLETTMYGYEPTHDKMKQWQKVMWDQVEDPLSYPMFQQALLSKRFIFENCSYHTYGRTTVDTAALGIPAVGSNRVWSMRKCYPNMSFDPFDCKSMLRCMDKIFKGGSWLDKQIDIAQENVEFFNYKNSEKRYMEMVEYGQDRKGKEV